MRSFRSFFKTKVGRKPQSEAAGETKSAEGSSYAAGAASIRNAFGGGATEAAPAPEAAPASVSPDTGSLGGNISGAIGRFLGQ